MSTLSHWSVFEKQDATKGLIRKSILPLQKNTWVHSNPMNESLLGHGPARPNLPLQF